MAGRIEIPPATFAGRIYIRHVATGGKGGGRPPPIMDLAPLKTKENGSKKRKKWAFALPKWGLASPPHQKDPAPFQKWHPGNVPDIYYMFKKIILFIFLLSNLYYLHLNQTLLEVVCKLSSPCGIILLFTIMNEDSVGWYVFNVY